jgi:hypothetical protein
MRRENNLIGNLLIDAMENNDHELMTAVYHGVASYTVFTTIGKDDEPICSLQRSATCERPIAYLRWTFWVLIYLPVFTILFMIGVDLVSLLREAVARNPEVRLYTQLEWYEVVQLVIIELLAAFICGVVTITCHNILRFEHCTGEMLRQFNESLFHPHPPL